MKINKKTQIEALLNEGKKAKEIAQVTNAHIVYIYQIKSKMQKETTPVAVTSC
tara:strand:- start:832 stop:990 length:159 start_codon:yes stop_codon:yes gene_type:complete